MSSAETSKVKSSYRTDKHHEEKLQAAKLDVQLQKVPARTTARLHKVRPN